MIASSQTPNALFGPPPPDVSLPPPSSTILPIITSLLSLVLHLSLFLQLHLPVPFHLQQLRSCKELLDNLLLKSVRSFQF
uniref:Uncharacterized protein n=1 Tax=Gossypium raimondii TaxID=29730 RepID=A0A0D2N8U0_GOSRA|nr:hypothetical protein B456_001G126100 [Gossypium raimondii]